MAREWMEGATKHFFLAGLGILVTVVGIGTTLSPSYWHSINISLRDYLVVAVNIK
jgi:hypothetical protein